MQQLNSLPCNFDSWYEQLENDYEDDRLKKIEESNLYEEYIESIGITDEQEEVC